MSENRILFSIIIILFILSYSINSQTYKSEFLTINDGLSQKSASAIIQDRKGFIWIGTKDGLNKYDGISCSVYRHSENKNSLVNNNIKCMYEDSRGNIWIGTYGGLSKFIPETEHFISYKKNDSTTLCSNLITTILEDFSHNIWIGTSEGLNKITINPNGDEKIVGVSNGGDIFKTLDKKRISSLFEDQQKNIWIGTQAYGLFCINSKEKKIINYPFDFLQKDGSTLTVTSIAELSNDELLVGTTPQGVYIFNKQNKKFRKYSPDVKENDKYYIHVARVENTGKDCFVLTNRVLYKIMKDDDVTLWVNHVIPAPTTFLIDKSGIIWIGSDGAGILKLKPVTKNFNTVTKENSSQNGYRFSSVRAILKVKGSLFIGGYTGMLEAKNYRSGKSVDWKNVDAFEKLNIYSLAADSSEPDILWAGTEGYGLYQYNLNTGVYKLYKADNSKINSLPGNTIYDILISRSKDIYFATNSGAAKYNRESSSFINFIYNPQDPNTISEGKVIALCEDESGNIWMGTENSGISIYNVNSSTFKRIESNSITNNSFSFSGNRINVIFEDSKKNMWIGTTNGLYKYFLKTNTAKVYKTDNGLPNDCVYGILEDESGCLWLSTNIGISKFNPANETFTNYDYSFGLQSNEFNSAAYYKDADGEMFLGGIKGFTSFYSNEIIQNIYAPSTVITNFKKFNRRSELDKSISYSEKLVLPYSDYFFSFDFIMPEYSNPLNNKFKYKLAGFDDRWIKLEAGQRTATFNGIPPGEYTLIIKGANSDGVWSGESYLKIFITPPFWQTWIFRTAVILIIGALIIFLFRRKINQLKLEKIKQQEFSKKLIENQESERKRIAGELHDSIGQDLLIARNKLILKSDSGNGEFINDVSSLLLHSIEDLSRISHNLHPAELDELGLTLAIEAMTDRVAEASEIKFNFKVDNIDGLLGKDDEINLFRIIQEAFNNIVKHSKATQAAIRSQFADGNLVIEISDNGTGFCSETRNFRDRPHFGISAMKERSKLIGGKLNMFSDGTGTKVEIIIALEKQKV